MTVKSVNGTGIKNDELRWKRKQRGDSTAICHFTVFHVDDVTKEIEDKYRKCIFSETNFDGTCCPWENIAGAHDVIYMYGIPADHLEKTPSNFDIALWGKRAKVGEVLNVWNSCLRISPLLSGEKWSFKDVTFQNLTTFRIGKYYNDGTKFQGVEVSFDFQPTDFKDTGKHEDPEHVLLEFHEMAYKCLQKQVIFTTQDSSFHYGDFNNKKVVEFLRWKKDNRKRLANIPESYLSLIEIMVSEYHSHLPLRYADYSENHEYCAEATLDFEKYLQDCKKELGKTETEMLRRFK